MKKKILLKSMETEFIFQKFHSSTNCLILSAKDRQDLKVIMVCSDILDLVLEALMASDMEEEAEKDAPSKIKAR
jgi:hypothetical protein